jgi:hypothetical protein
MSEEKQHDNDRDDRKRLLHHIFTLLEYLERQSDNRLQAQFEDTRLKLGINSTKVAIPPCDNYNEFFVRLAEIRQNSSSTALSPTDEQFLRSSRDFLAVVAHPATVETISITREYINSRAACASGAWRMRLQKWAVFIRLPQTGAVTKEDGFKDSAHSLARIVRWAERLAVLATVLALFFSGHAMVGRLIISQEKDALTRFQELTKATDADRIGLFRVPGAATLVKPNPDRGCPAEYPMDANHDATPQMEKIAEQQQQTASTHTIGITDSYIAAQEAAWTLVTECRKVQWALMQLVTENIRLKSWDAPYIRFASFLIGWDEPTIKSVRKASKREFCDQVAAAYHEEPGVGCKKIFNLLIRDSSSVANSVLGWLTLYILPCLYAFIGAAAAAVIGIRRKLNASLLAYSDRGWVKQALILGFVFGGVIGLFAGYLSKSPDSDGLGLSALALLAGYNVPAVSEMLEDLSKRIFRPGERDGQAAKAA